MDKEMIIDRDTCTDLERSLYEYESRKDLIVYMISNHMMNDPKFKEYHDEFVHFFRESNILKQNMIEKYAPSDSPVNWRLEFRTRKLTIKN